MQTLSRYMHMYLHQDTKYTLPTIFLQLQKHKRHHDIIVLLSPRFYVSVPFFSYHRNIPTRYADTPWYFTTHAQMLPHVRYRFDISQDNHANFRCTNIEDNRIELYIHIKQENKQ